MPPFAERLSDARGVDDDWVALPGAVTAEAAVASRPISAASDVTMIAPAVRVRLCMDLPLSGFMP
jgi:hypothetical protein